MLFPNIVMSTFPVPGLVAGKTLETTTPSKVKTFVDEPRRTPTDTMAEIRDAEPRTLFDLTDDSETQFEEEQDV